jgi:hypothetical protein
MKSRPIVPLMFALAALFAAAGPAAAALQNNLTLTQVGPGDGGEAFYVWASNSAAMDGCPNNRFVLDTAHPQYDLLVSILLTARVAQKPVLITTSGCRGADMNIKGVRVL